MDAKENGEQGITGYATECGCSHGLTKREEFAAMAMQGVLSASPHIHDYPSQASALAIEHADALLCALSHSAGGEA